MGYADDIALDKPADDDEISEGDDALRQNFRAIWQRLSNLVQDPDADPLILNPVVLSVFKKHRISHTSFQPRDNTSSISRGVGEISPSSHASLAVYGTITIQAGLQLTTARIKVESLDPLATITGTLYHVFEGDGPDILCEFSAVAGAAGPQVLEADCPFNAQEGDLFTFLVIMNTTASTNGNDAQLSWAEIETA